MSATGVASVSKLEITVVMTFFCRLVRYILEDGNFRSRYRENLKPSNFASFGTNLTNVKHNAIERCCDFDAEKSL
jgi:hypothetical protein